MSVVPSPWSVVHIARRISTDPADEDDHGNLPPIISSPVVRKVMSFVQKGVTGNSHLISDTESARRVETTLEMATAEPEVYEAMDQVLIFPTLDVSGDYVSGTGTAFFVDGKPTDDRVGPWPGLLAMFGGVVNLRRVT